MNDLLTAVKAVLDCWDHGRPIDMRLKNLSAAVERAEKQEVATDFCEWWHSNDYGNYGIHHAQLAWTAAQQAERERIKEIVGKLSTPKDPWIHYSTLLEKIDAAL